MRPDEHCPDCGHLASMHNPPSGAGCMGSPAGRFVASPGATRCPCRATEDEVHAAVAR